METPGLVEIRSVKFLQKVVFKKLFAVSPFLFGKVILAGESDPYRLNTGTLRSAVPSAIVHVRTCFVIRDTRHF